MKGANKQFVQLIIMDPFRKDNIVLETKLYNEDCIVAMKKIDTNSIDLIITDPPYNLGNFMRNRDTNLSKMRDNFLDRQAGMIWTFRNGKNLWIVF